ncbi:putative E3 ubiquitin-protein ligase ARI8 [Hordeum vulgare]|nr:putative E3 ubiquitin-protein ligase ARI8 [Hordeum vulgare]
MLSYKPSNPWVVKEFYHTTHENLWWILLKPRHEWPAEDEDTGLDAKTPALEDWLAKAENIDDLAPLPEEPRLALLSLMLVVAPYMTPMNKKETRGGLRLRCPPDNKSRDTHASCTREGEDAEDEEEKDSFQMRKREAPEGAEDGLPPRALKRPCKSKVALLAADLDSDDELRAFETVPC